MKYCIMCGGKYNQWKSPKQLSVIKGEILVERTIRLLKANGCTEIYISSNDPRFDNFGVIRLEHFNSFVMNNGSGFGYWLDAFYPFNDNDKVTYLYGDVWYTDNAIKMIVNCDRDGNILYGTSEAKNPLHENWGEPFAYVVNDYRAFRKGITAVKKLQDDNKLKRTAITWELYRYLNGLDVNRQEVLDDTYICIDDGTIDVDDPKMIEVLNGR